MDLAALARLAASCFSEIRDGVAMLIEGRFRRVGDEGGWKRDVREMGKLAIYAGGKLHVERFHSVFRSVISRNSRKIMQIFPKHIP